MRRAAFAVLFSCLLCVTAVLYADQERKDIPIEQLGQQYQLVGKLGVPLGQVVRVEGEIVEGDPNLKDRGGPWLRVSRIAGQPTPTEVSVEIEPYFYKWGEPAEFGGAALPKLEVGATYEMEGYETGGFVGAPEEAADRAGVAIQNYEFGYSFREHLVVYKATLIKVSENR